MPPSPMGVSTTAVAGLDDVRTFFDDWAERYVEQHGRPGRLLASRLRLIRQHARPRATDLVLDVGCGPGDHLLALAPEIRRGLGVDLSPAMIEVARRRRHGAAVAQRVHFAVDDSATLASVPDQSVDLAMCIGAFEHMLDKAAVLTSIRRTLKPGGRFFCLTPNADYVWYRRIAPRLRLATKHLSTDAFESRRSFLELLGRSGYRRIESGAWSFIPRGDMPRALGRGLAVLDLVGRVTGMRSLRGGLWVSARR